MKNTPCCVEYFVLSLFNGGNIPLTSDNRLLECLSHSWSKPVKPSALQASLLTHPPVWFEVRLLSRDCSTLLTGTFQVSSLITRKPNFETVSCPEVSFPPNQFIFLIPSSLFGAHIHQSKSPVAASSYRRGCGRPRTWQPGALAWKQRQAEDTRGGCGRQGRTDRSRRSHSQAEKHTQTHRMCHPLKESPSQLLYSWFLTENTLQNTTSVPECLFKSNQIRSSLMYTKISRL